MASPFSDGFFARDPSAKDFDVVASKYKQHVLNHIMEHYEMNVRTISADSTNNQPVTLPRLLYYHVYGDYILTMKDGQSTYTLRQIPSTVAVPQIETYSQMGAGYPFAQYMGLSEEGHLSGLFSQVAVRPSEDSGLKVKVENKTGEINWINQDINNQGIGVRFLLPSIGTQAVKLHELGNQSDFLRDAFANELYACATALTKMNDDSPLKPFDADAAGYGTFHPEYAILNNFHPTGAPPANYNKEISPVLAILGNMLLRNPDYIQLEADYGIADDNRPFPNPADITGKIGTVDKGVYNKTNNFDDDYEAAKNLASYLFKKGTQSFSIGDDVLINTDRLLNAIESVMDPDKQMPDSTPYMDPTRSSDYTPYQKPGDSATRIAIISVSPPEGVKGQFAISIDGTPWAEERIDAGTPTGEPDPTNLRWVAASDLSLRVGFEPALEEDGTPIPDEYTADFSAYVGDVRKSKAPKKKGKKSKKSKGKAVLAPETLVFQRILIDTLATLQMILAVGDHYDYSNEEQQFREEIKVRYLSGALNAKRGNRAIHEQYPNIYPPTATGVVPAIESVIKKKAKGGGKAKKGLMDFLAARRAYYTLSILSTQRAKVPYKESMDAFYGEDILLQEIGWLSTLIGDSATYAMRKREPWKDDYTAQLQYDEVPGSIKPKRQMAYMPKRTVFYQIETPLLKEVIADYLSVYNQMTLGAAFDIDKGYVKEQELANAIWGSVRTRTTGLFDTEGLRAHEFFASLFNNVDVRLDRSSILKSHYPPSWLGDNTIQKLQTDPNTIGLSIEEGYYQKKLIEYVDHLGNVYKGNYAVPLQIITEVEKTKIRYNRDPISLKEEFFNRIKNDNAKKRLKTTWFLFKPYSAVISIIRAHLDVPFNERKQFVAETLNEEQADLIKERIVDPDKGPSLVPIVPSSHPLHGVDD